MLPLQVATGDAYHYPEKVPGDLARLFYGCPEGTRGKSATQKTDRLDLLRDFDWPTGSWQLGGGGVDWQGYCDSCTKSGEDAIGHHRCMVHC